MIEEPPKENSADLATSAVGETNRRGFLLKSLLVCSGGAAGLWLTYKHRHEIVSGWSHWTKETAEKESVSTLKKRESSIPDLASVRDYRAYLAKNKLPYLSADEIIRPQFKYRSGVCSGVPPKHLWRNIRQTARVANEIRHRLGVPLNTVISAYRSPEYNDRCPGASKNSQHLKNRALDLIYACPPKKAFEMAAQLRNEGFFKGGIGLYSGFIHIDTRGKNATWGV